MQQTMFSLIIMNVLVNHAIAEQPLTIAQITDLINQEFAAFSFNKEPLMNQTLE